MTEKELLKDLEKILLYQDKYSDKVISLYDLSKVIKKKNLYYKKMLAKTSKTTIQNNCENIQFHIESINYDTNEVILSLEFGHHHQIVCKKVNDEIILTPLNPSPDFTLSRFNTDEISSLYEEIMDFKDYTKEEYYGISLSNYPSFLINITPDGITTYKDNENLLLSSYIFKEEYILTTNSKNIRKLISGNEELILKNLFIKIEKCPKWSQEKLQKIRQHQIEKNAPHKVKKLKK